MSELIDLGKEVLKTNNSVIGFIAGLGLVAWLIFKRYFIQKSEVDLLVLNAKLEAENKHLKERLAELTGEEVK